MNGPPDYPSTDPPTSGDTMPDLDTPDTPDTDDLRDVVRVEVDLGLLLARATGTYDDEPRYRELADLVIDEAARQLTDRIVSEAGRDLKEQVRGRFEEAIDAPVQRMVTAAVEGVVESGKWRRYRHRDTDEPQTLQEVIVAMATEWLTKDHREYVGGRDKVSTKAQAWLSKAVDHTIKKQLAAALEEGRAEVRQALRDQGAQLLQEAIERQAAGS